MDKTKLQLLKHSIGDGIEIYNTLKIDKEENDRTLKEVLDALNAYCRHKSNATLEAFKYKKKKQEPGEPIETFITEPKSLEAK